jgi:sulfur-carrier protein
MDDTVSVVVVLFASHREVLGQSRVSLSVPRGTSVEGLYGELARREPRLKELRPFTTFAVNREVVDPSTILRDEDEVALLQPVSGGYGD